jgi:hypothetical protein
MGGYGTVSREVSSAEGDACENPPPLLRAAATLTLTSSGDLTLVPETKKTTMKKTAKCTR